MQSGSAFGADRQAARKTAPADRPWLDGRDILKLLWRERGLMLVVFACIAALGVVVALKQKTLYTAHSSLLLRLGQEYVYNPRVGDGTSPGIAPDMDQVVQSEVAILSSAELKERVIHDIGLARLFPQLAGRYARANAYQRRDIESGAIRAIAANLKIQTAPGTSVVNLTYAHPDPQMAATVLNTLIDEYLNYRKTVLIGHDAALIADERRAFQTRLEAAEAAYQKFLADHGVSDFDTERTTLSQLYGQLLTDRYNVQTRLSETQGRLGATASEAANAPEEIGLYRDVDHAAADKLLQLRLDRQDLLSKYKPGAGPIKDIDRRIAELESLAGSGKAVGPGALRVGVNPIYQTLQTEQNQLQADAASLRNRQAALNAELAQVAARRQQLNALEPQYQDLARQRDVLAANVRSLAQREQETQAQQAIAQRAADNVRVVERAYVPTTGSSLKKPLLVLAILFAAFAALCAGLFRAFLEHEAPPRGPTRRTLDLPILATAPLKS